MKTVLIQRFSVIALVALSVFTAMSQLIQVAENWDPSSRVNNPYSRWDELMRSVKKKLPMESGIVGYLADWDIPDTNYSMSNQQAEWQLTQYGLAPLIVVRQPREWTIGNFSSPNFELWLDKKIGDYEIEYLGSSIYLIHDLDN